MGERMPPYIPARFDRAVWSEMSGLDRSAVTHALQRLPLVRAVLAGSHAQIACFHIDLRARRRQYACTMWRGNADTGFVIEDGTSALTHGTLSEICGALAPLARHLASRWPERARPGVIGVATDGHRVIFNAGHPACRDHGWLEEHIAGRSPGTIVADDGKPGLLEKLSPRKERTT